jgi:hypothetical protein
MELTFKFYTFQSVGKKIKIQKISGKKLIKKPCLLRTAKTMFFY